MRRGESEKGQAMVEYAVLFGAIVVVAVVGFGGISETAGKIYDMVRTILIPAFP
ncbi:hypothetical protein AALB39_11395 [Lachnospiraceae bacterium 54-53]